MSAELWIVLLAVLAVIVVVAAVLVVRARRASGTVLATRNGSGSRRG